MAAMDVVDSHGNGLFRDCHPSFGHPAGIDARAVDQQHGGTLDLSIMPMR